MRILNIQSTNGSLTTTSTDVQIDLKNMDPLDLLTYAIAKDIHNEINRKASHFEIGPIDFSCQIIMRKNEEKEKSKIIETHLMLPGDLNENLKTKFKRIANQSHLKRLLSNEFIFEETWLKNN